jgi:hypothetical protein
MTVCGGGSEIGEETFEMTTDVTEIRSGSALQTRPDRQCRADPARRGVEPPVAAEP